MTSILTVVEDDIELIEVAGQGPVGPPGPPGTGGAQSAGVFALDVTSSGVVGAKVFETRALLSCSTDTSTARVHIGCDGGAGAYTPTATVEGVPVVLTETSTRWFTGYADITLAAVGENIITIESSAGTSSHLLVTRLAGGAEVLSVTFGAYPGTQTALKSGDQLPITITTDPTAVQVTINGGAVASCSPLTVTNGVATGTLTIGTAPGTANFTVSARNAFGTYGAAFVTPTLNLDQTYPTFGTISIAYPPGKLALGTADQATVSCAVSNADVVSYQTVGLLVDQTYTVNKTVANTSSGYVATGTNYTVSATRSANNAQASVSALVKIATVAPTASITTPVRLLSSPAGTNHEIRIYPTQTLFSAPTLTAPVGVWQGSWINNGNYWSRSLRITDADPKGTHTFTGLTLTGLSGIAGSTITSGANYTLGGMSSRTLVFAAFSRTTALGCAVGDQTKTSASIVGGNTLSRMITNSVSPNGYYIANADGTYNPNGAFLGLSDSAFAGANTSGTLQATFAEAA